MSKGCCGRRGCRVKALGGSTGGVGAIAAAVVVVVVAERGELGVRLLLLLLLRFGIIRWRWCIYTWWWI